MNKSDYCGFSKLKIGEKIDCPGFPLVADITDYGDLVLEFTENIDCDENLILCSGQRCIFELSPGFKKDLNVWRNRNFKRWSIPCDATLIYDDGVFNLEIG